MPYALNNVTVSNTEYTDAATLSCTGAVQLDVVVANAAVYYSYRVRESGGLGANAVGWRDEIYLPPGFHTRARATDAVRFRAADGAAALAAQVTVEAATLEEIRR